MSQPNMDATVLDWGLLPPAVKQHVIITEWDNRARFKTRLLNQRPFPIKINLKPPKGRRAVHALDHFQTYVAAWQNYPRQDWLEWQTRTYRDIGQQSVPQYLVLSNIKDLIDYLGETAEMKGRQWAETMTPLLALPGDTIYPVLVKHLETLDEMSVVETQRMADLISQLKAGLGAKNYLRALPVVGVGTEYLEQYQAMITDILDAQHAGAITQAGGLEAWLECAQNPTDWLWVRPLCAVTQQKMGGFPIMQLPQDVLQQHALPATHILVIENQQPGLGLPALDDTIAVFGGGNNVTWMKATWLQDKRVGYWGDIDTWGLAILGDVRQQVPLVTSLMMDQATWEQFKAQRAEAPPSSLAECPAGLTVAEQHVFAALTVEGSVMRLQQERLSADYSAQVLQEWVKTGSKAISK